MSKVSKTLLPASPSAETLDCPWYPKFNSNPNAVINLNIAFWPFVFSNFASSLTAPDAKPADTELYTSGQI